MKLQKRILALAVASALVAPNALAVQGSDGMHYTSASEGLYASIRAQFVSGDGVVDTNAKIQNSGSRFGIQGTGEMAHGLEASYRYEAGVGIDNGSGLSTRMGQVGLRGNFGSMLVGTVWDDTYNWVTSATDLPNSGGGNFAPVFRKSNSLIYNSPDFNGLQVSGRFTLDGGSSKAPSTDNDLDEWALSGKYAFQGFTVGATYMNTPDADTVGTLANDGTIGGESTEDATFWALRAGYSQDNWSVNAWYGANNQSDFGIGDSNADGDKDALAAADRKKQEDETTFSIAASVDIGQTTVVVLHETKETAFGGDDTATVFDIQYKLNSKAKVWAGYVSKDFDSATVAADEKDDFFNLGLRHDF